MTVSTDALLTAMQTYAQCRAAVAAAQTAQQAAADALHKAAADMATAAVAVDTQMAAVYTAIGGAV